MGLGDFGSRYVRAIDSSPHWKLVGVVDTDSEKLAASVRSEGIHTAHSLEQVLESVPADAVVICSPPEAHQEAIVAAVARKIPVLVEKPIVNNRAGFSFLSELSQAERALVVPAHISRHLESIHMLRTRVAEERIELINAWRYVPRERLAVHGLDHPALSAMVHDFDLVNALDPSKVIDLSTVSSRSRPDRLNPDTVISTARLESGALAIVGNSWGLPNSSRYVESRLEVVTDRSKYTVNIPSASLIVASANGDEFPAPELGVAEPADGSGAFGRQLRAFHGVVSGLARPQVTVEDALWSLDLALRVVEQAP